MLEKIKEIAADSLGADVSTMTAETSFKEDLGADSLDVFQIIMGIEEEFDIEIDNEEAEKITTVQDAVDQIKKAVE
jgi:acyl carrier protein